MASNERHAPVRVVMVSHTGQLGGAESAMLRLVAAADARFAISVITMAEGPFVDEARRAGVPITVIDGGEIVRLTRAQTGSVGALLSSMRATAALGRVLAREVRNSNADLIVANSLKAAVLLGVAVRPRRWVWHLHDRLAGDYLPGPVVVGLRILARCGPRRIVANSRSTAATAGRLPRGRVVVAYPGLDARAFARPKRRAGRGPVGIVGRLASTKGQREFVDAAIRVALRHRRTRFRIVGAALFDDASYGEELAARIATSGLGQRIEQTGWVDDPATEFRGFSLLVHASPVPEPFGQVIVEAMAVGTPVVATDAGGVREIIDPRNQAVTVADGVRRAPHGLLVRPGDAVALSSAIEWMLDRPAEASTMAALAHADARERFTINRTWAAVAAVWMDAAD